MGCSWPVAGIEACRPSDRCITHSGHPGAKGRSESYPCRSAPGSGWLDPTQLSRSIFSEAAVRIAEKQPFGSRHWGAATFNCTPMTTGEPGANWGARWSLGYAGSSSRSYRHLLCRTVRFASAPCGANTGSGCNSCPQCRRVVRQFSSTFWRGSDGDIARCAVST
jgi:hypothetical protein